MFNDIYGSHGSRSHRSSYVLAYWPANAGKIVDLNDIYKSPRPGRVSYFIKKYIYVDTVCFEYVLAYVEWFLPLCDQERLYYGKPVEVWNSYLFELSGAATFILVQRIKNKFVRIITRKFGKEVMIVLPRCRSLNI